MPQPRTLEYSKGGRRDKLGKWGNVAQLVSFGPDLEQRFSRIRGFEPNHRFSEAREALTTLLDRSPERRVNIRSFKPDDPQGHEFVYGIHSADIAVEQLARLTASGLCVLVNDTLHVNGG